MYVPTYGNCLLFAIVNLFLYGGSLKICKWYPIPHVMWVDKRNRTWSYTSICKYHKGHHDDFVTELWFKGAAVRKFMSHS